MTEELIADAQRLAEDVSQRADYGGVFQAIQAGIEHILDSRDEWRRLTRAELIDNLMAVHHAGLTPQISVAVVGLASDVGRDLLHERGRLAARVAELERQVEQAREGGKFLGEAIAELNDIALDATGMHDAIDENRNGDWQAVWENVSDLGERLRAAQRRIADLQAMNSGAEHRIDELESDLVRIAKLEAERDSARAQFGLLFDFLAERGASFDTERGKVVAVRMPSKGEK
ncbi:hypothetical protein [Nocardia abscessus]|uniref:hypothetical protein n=1 Tax=Nocardia abscessus TaxID=120957 RepID=UPI0003120C33|nr:hypothetical protein [Nocardia abscessus]MCC3333530.1 hypothetical protein [Nocardia abscessus]